MSDNEVKEIFWQSYNTFWNKWKPAPLRRKSEEWEQVKEEAQGIMEEHDVPLCRQIILGLLTELEDRCRKREEEFDA